MTEPDPKLSDRLEAARDRSAALAKGAAGRARDFVHEHPVASVAGGVAIGALIAGVLARRQRGAADADQTGDSRDSLHGLTAARLAQIAAVGAEFALAYATRAAGAGKQGVGIVEDTIIEHLGQIGSNGAEAGRKLGDIAEIAVKTLREAGEAALHRLTQRD